VCPSIEFGWNGSAQPGSENRASPGYTNGMIILGLILLILGLLLGVPILWTIGLILIVVGAVLWLLGSAGHAVGGRRHYW
jgi:fatty acid desaturase